jgi:hypothetical protein
VHLYQGTSAQFIGDAMQARLANQLAQRFFEEFRYKPAPSEIMSWRNSLGAMTRFQDTSTRLRSPQFSGVAMQSHQT